MRVASVVALQMVIRPFEHMTTPLISAFSWSRGLSLVCRLSRVPPELCTNEKVGILWEDGRGMLPPP